MSMGGAVGLMRASLHFFGRTVSFSHRANDLDIRVEVLDRILEHREKTYVRAARHQFGLV